MDVQSLAFRTDLALLRLSGSEIDDRGSHIVVRTPDNPDYRWGNFYLLARPPGADEVEALLASYDAEFPDSQHRAFGVDGIEDQHAALSPLAAVVPGIDVATVMTATEVHPPPRPNTEATYRPLASDDDWAQRLEMSLVVHDNETDLDLHREFAIKRALADRGLHEAGHGAWWGAFVGDRLASVMGLVDAGGGLARYQSVETLPDYRGRGLAGTLVHRVAEFGFSALGATTLVMVADPEYLAIRIYRSVGFDDTEAQTQLEQRDRTS